MPLYEYVCANGHRTEVMHGVHDTGPTTCPVCGAAMRKAFVAPTIHFKGSGWAKMDRRSSSGKKSAEPSTAEAASSTDSSPTGTSASASSGGAATTSSTEKPAPKTASSATD